MLQKGVTQDRLQDACVPLDASIHEAMLGLGRGAVGIVLVVDAKRHLMGSITDGDIRRALLNGASLNASILEHMQRAFTAVGVGADRVEVLDLMHARGIEQIPIVDGDGKLVGLHVMREIIGAAVRPNVAVIMAGGKGVRLRPITEHLPKPMIPVAGRPILERLVLHLVGSGITHIYLSVNYMAEVIIRHFGDGSRYGCHISYLHETEELGTGGALSLLPSIPADPIVVLNGDLVTQLDFASMLAFHAASKSAATIGYRPYSHQVPFGCLDIRDDAVIGIQEKPVLERCVNAGVYVISPKVLELVPRKFFPITELFQTLLDRGDKVGSYEITTDWTDVGQHSELSKARGGA